MVNNSAALRGIPLRDRLLAQCDKREDGCWIWNRTIVQRYGQLRGRGAKLVRAHRASYETFVGEIPDGLCVLHSCDRPLCINPDHLRVGTRAENMAEAAQRGRTARGRLHGFHLHPGSVGRRPNGRFTNSKADQEAT